MFEKDPYFLFLSEQYNRDLNVFTSSYFSNAMFMSSINLWSKVNEITIIQDKISLLSSIPVFSKSLGENISTITILMFRYPIIYISILITPNSYNFYTKSILNDGRIIFPNFYLLIIVSITINKPRKYSLASLVTLWCIQ
jgi:hypothetical protein